jgi:hypothetical protein
MPVDDGYAEQRVANGQFPARAQLGFLHLDFLPAPAADDMIAAIRARSLYSL